MSNKTATQLIFDYLETIGIKLHEDTKRNFSEIHKEQIIEAYKTGVWMTNTAEQYYTEKYELKKSH